MKLSTLECPRGWSNLKTHLKSCFFSEEYSDVTLLFIDKQTGESLSSLRTHKVVLSSGSAYLKSLVLGGSDENNSIRINVDGRIPSSLWKRLIGYLYDGSITYNEEEYARILEASQELDIDFPNSSLLWKCLHCKEGFQSGESFLTHSKVFHESLFAKCGPCSKIVEDWSSFNAHLCSKSAEVKSEEPWSPEEDLLFIPEMSLQEIDVQEDPLASSPTIPPKKSCTTLKTKSTSSINLRNSHKSRNGGRGPNVNSKKFLCSICGRTLTGLTAYNRHQVIHTGARPYSCDTCGKTFTQKQRLVVHTRSHTGERPYMCSLCGKTFTESCKLKRHSTKVHKIDKDGGSLIGMVLKNGDNIKVSSSSDPMGEKWNQSMDKSPSSQQPPPTSSLMSDSTNYCSIVKEELLDKKPEKMPSRINE